MAESELIPIQEIYLKTDRSQGNMVVLKESENAPQYFLMFVGDAEVTAIAKEKGFVDSKRPLTHDLYISMLVSAGIEVLRVEVYEMRENTYFAKVYTKVDGEELIFDSRPSDAVALALNRKCPIFVSKKLFRKELTPEEIKEYEEIVKTVKF